ncbi:MAG: TIGR03032 family protein [Rhodospirillaceae bacterium]|nr:TIGR03032 family protein [Rhodospirillaceae bacterium]MBT6116645.1 TIGR03032 family protein [Rhodospirillaceae bacterium]
MAERDDTADAAAVEPGEESPTPGGRGPTLAEQLKVSASRQFAGWLVERKASLAFTTYQAGKLFMLGIKEGGRLSIFERTFPRCMGLTGDGQTLWMSSLFQFWRFENALEPGQDYRGYDRLYVPQAGYTTGDIDAHDIAVGRDGRPIFVNTLFSCLATVSESHSFRPVWRPPFVSRLAAEDRCHLNGLAAEEGVPRFATAVARTDVADGWRDNRQSGGVVIDIDSGEIVAEGFSMPHSPRLHDGRLWLLDSGTGRFGHVELETGRFEEVAFCPGYARGLCFIDDFAVIGISKPRDDTFGGLPLDGILKEKAVEPRCGLLVIDLRTGDTVHWFRLDGVVSELYDVVALPGVVRPMALGFRTDEIRRTLTMEGAEEGRAPNA